MKLHLLFLLAFTPGITAMTWSKKTRPKSVKVHVKTTSSSGALESTTKPNPGCATENTPLTWEEIQGFLVELTKNGGRVLNALINGSYVEKIDRTLSDEQIIEVFEYALSKKIGRPNSEIELDNEEEQNTPLHIASRLGKIELIVLLLKYGAKTNVLNQQKETPLELLLKNGIKAKNDREVALLKNILQQFLQPISLTSKPIKK